MIFYNMCQDVNKVKCNIKKKISNAISAIYSKIKIIYNEGLTKICAIFPPIFNRQCDYEKL